MRLPKLRFSLRTMLVLVTLVCIFCCYLGWALNWIRQRMNTTATFEGIAYIRRHGDGLPFDQLHEGQGVPQLSLRMLGERGIDEFYVYSMSRQDFDSICSLFPEAEVVGFESDENERTFTRLTRMPWTQQITSEAGVRSVIPVEANPPDPQM